MIANQVESYICSDENTLKGRIMDVARIMVRTYSGAVLKEKLVVNIDGLDFVISLSEYWHGPLRLQAQNPVKTTMASDSSSFEYGVDVVDWL